MAKILPFQAWHYHSKYWAVLKNLVAPLADNLSDEGIEQLFQHPKNSIHLTPVSIKLGPHHAQKKLLKWKEDQTLVQDSEPAIYVYYQQFRLKGETHCLKGFIALIKLEDKKTIIGHEDTMDTPIKNQVNLLENTQLQPNPTHGLYEDPNISLEPLMDQAMTSPLFEFKNQQGIKQSIAVIQDPATIQKFIETMEPQTIILADGHHRLGGAIAFQKSQQEKSAQQVERASYNYHMMYFTNACSKDLKILPTHRLFRNLNLSHDEIISRLEKDFSIKKLNDPIDINNTKLNKPWSFLLLFQKEAYLIHLRPKRQEAYPKNSPEAIRNLDLSILHHFFVKQVLGIPKNEQSNSNRILYERDIEQCFRKVQNGEASLAVFTREISIQEVIAVCKSGFTMPQKSTYFYPKTLTGLLFYSLNQKDFKFPYDTIS